MADIPAIMKFIDEHWKKDHILARDRAFFEYQYVTDGRVTFVVAEDTEDGSDVSSLSGILGYVPYDHAQKHISLALWKALKSGSGMIGLQLLDFLQKQLKPETIATPGVDPDTTMAIYKLFRYEVGVMRHFYRLMERDAYRIAKVGATQETVLPCDASAHSGSLSCVAQPPAAPGSVTRLNTFDEYLAARIFFAVHAIPKEDWYIEKRYFNHPVYTYEMILVRRSSSDALLIVARVQKTADSACLRIVDLIGDYSLLPRATEMLDELCDEHDCEYIDCYVTGITPELFSQAGFNERLPLTEQPEQDIIIPNHFSPFEQRNVDIWYSTLPEDTVILRGDGDQDRPS